MHATAIAARCGSLQPGHVRPGALRHGDDGRVVSFFAPRTVPGEPRRSCHREVAAIIFKARRDGRPCLASGALRARPQHRTPRGRGHARVAGQLQRPRQIWQGRRRMEQAERAVLVTGASGHLGSNLVRRLLERGEHVRAMVRRPEHRGDLPRHERLELVAGDLLDPRSLRAAVEGCDRVYHVTAIYALWTPTPGVILDTALRGTTNMFDAIVQSGGVRRLVFTSSAIAVGFSSDPEALLTERDWNDGRGQDEYNRAKIESERLAHRLAKEHGIDMVVVNPALIVGPGDHKPTPSNRLVLDYIHGAVPVSYRGGLSVVHVDDVCQGHLAAMERGKAGERYLLGGENLTM